MVDTLLIDPLGRRIMFHDHTWYGHVLKRHPEMTGLRGLAHASVRLPLAIHYSTSEPDCRTYYGPGPRPGIMVAVIADVVIGVVKTAYLTNKKKGAPEW